MIESGLSRRKLLLYCSHGLLMNSMAASWPAFAQPQHNHLSPAPAPESLQFFTPDQAADIEAVADLIIPADDTPGAREARVIHFIDKALATFDRDKQSLYRAGLEQLRALINASLPGARRMQDLTGDQQVKLIPQIEHSEFFEALRTHTIMGFFGNPSYGGNQGQAGWKLIGFEDKFVFKPPFGYYDSDPALKDPNEPAAQGAE